MGEVLKNVSKVYPDHPAVVYWDFKVVRKKTYKELNEESNRVAGMLMSLGVRKGDKVALMFYNSPEFIESYFGAIKIGAVAVPINYRLSAREIAYQIDWADSKVVIYDGEFGKVMEEVKSELKKVTHWICFGEENPPDTLNYEKLKATLLHSYHKPRLTWLGGSV